MYHYCWCFLKVRINFLFQMSKFCTNNCRDFRCKLAKLCKNPAATDYIKCTWHHIPRHWLPWPGSCTRYPLFGSMYSKHQLTIIYIQAIACMYIIVSIKNYRGTSVVVCTDLWGKELHRQVSVGIMVTSGNLHGVILSHWPRMPEMWVQFPL